MGGRNVRARTYVGAGVPFSQIRNVKMKGITLEGVAAIGVVGEAIEKLTRRGVIAETDYPWCAPSTTSLLTMLPSICPGRSSSAEKSDVG
jgi:glycerol-3-phosphate dehydrogenase (NAD(P)+)